VTKFLNIDSIQRAFRRLLQSRDRHT